MIFVNFVDNLTIMQRGLNKIFKTFAAIVIMVALLPSINLSAKDFVVVIDAGHGGRDVGAVGKFAHEKNINLGVALKLGEMINDNFDDVKVVYTRSTDKFLTLQERAKLANDSHGDLFISIHTNSVDKKNKNRTSIHGAATYILGMHKNDENLEVAMRENSVIKLEKDFSTTYQGFDPNSTESYIIFEISQNQHVAQSIEFASRVQSEFKTVADRKDNGVRQAGFWVLSKTSMPAVLVELDFICNPTQEKYLDSEKGQEKLAKSIYNAFWSYKKSYFGEKTVKKSDKSKNKKSVKVEEPKKEKTAVAVENKPVETDELVYKIQFLTSNKKLNDNDTRLKGLKPVNYYYENGVYKYTYGALTDKKEALSLQKEIKKKFKEAFIVVFKGDKRVK